MGFITSTQFGLEHRDEGLHLTEVGHQVDVLRVGLAPHGLQHAHIHPANPDGKDLDPCLPRLSSYLLHRVLRSPVCHNHSDSWNVKVCRPRSVSLSEGCFHGVLDGQSSHCSCGKMLHVPHCLLHLSLGAEGVEGEFRLDLASILEEAHPGGIWPNLQKLEQVDDEGLDLLIVMVTDASGAIDDKDKIQWGSSAMVRCDRRSGGLWSVNQILKK